MSAKDPDVRSETESMLSDQLARSEERICMLEAQLALAQKSLPAERAEEPQTPASLPTRPPISMSAFNSNPFGSSTEGIAAVVQTAANVRNTPDLPQSAPDMPGSASEDFEPTARLDAGELRHAHRVLIRPRTPAYRRVEVGLLCLACGALWAGVWQMQAAHRHSRSASMPQTLAAVPSAAAYATPPVPVPPISPTPLPAPASAQREAGRPPVAAGTINGRTIVEPDSSPRIASAFRSAARVSLPVSAPHHAQAIAATARQDAGPDETRFYGRSAAARKPTPFLPPVILPAETPVARHASNRKTLAVGHTAGLKHNSPKTAQLIAFLPRRAAFFKPQPRSAVVSAPLSEPRSSYGLGSGHSEGSEEQVEEQAEAVHGTRAAAYDRDDRRDDRRDGIEANVDHALQTLDKMKALLDNMEHRRKSPAHP